MQVRILMDTVCGGYQVMRGEVVDASELDAITLIRLKKAEEWNNTVVKKIMEKTEKVVEKVVEKVTGGSVDHKETKKAVKHTKKKWS